MSNDVDTRNNNQEHIQIHIINIDDDEEDSGRDELTQLRAKMVEFERFKQKKDVVAFVNMKNERNEVEVLPYKPIIKLPRSIKTPSPTAGKRGLKVLPNDDVFDFITINTSKPPSKITDK